MSYVKSVPLSQLSKYSSADDQIVLLSSTDEQPGDAGEARTALGLGTAATTAATAYATAAQGMAATTGPLRVACVGTSITAQGSVLRTDFTPYIQDLSCGHAGWLEHLSSHRVRLVRRNGVFETLTDKTFGYSGYGLTGLTTGSSGLYPLDNAIASGPEVLVLEGGTNDVSGGETSAAILTKITAYWTKAVASGCRVIALNIPPMGSEMINSTKRDIITTVNAELPALATSLGVTLIDAYAAATIDGSGYATDESAHDGIHPTPAYAQRLAILINAQLAPLYAARPQAVIVPAAGSALWITPNNSPSGASQPASWTKIGTHTDTWTAITDDTDGTTWQRLRMVQGGSAGAINQFFTTLASLTVGHKVRLAVRLRSVSGAAFSAREVEFSMQYYVGATPYNVNALANGTNLGTGDIDPVDGLFVTAPVTIPTGASDIYAKFAFYNTDVTVDIRQFGVFRVIENQ